MSCSTGKIRYRDELGAMIALSETNLGSQKKSKRSERKAYRCPKCRGWHLSSQK